MPLYEFRCARCERVFEELVPMSAETWPPCPECGCGRVSKLMSAFSARVKSPSGGFRPVASSSGCSGCSSSNCSSCGK